MSSPHSPDDEASLELGQTLRSFVAGQRVFERYTLRAVLGRGGMGIVWRAFDEQLEREVALKFLPEMVIYDRSVVQDLKRETRRSLELTHANIVRIYDFVQDAQSACISMELVDGDTLANLRLEKAHNVFETSDLEHYVEQLCDALDYAHTRAQIVHRDLKPANLMVNGRNDLKVTDFGISRSLSDSVSMLTAGRGASGTLPYMSPQQLDGERASHLDDIYSLGASIYDLLTSRPPFYSGGIDRQIHEKIPPSMALRRDALQIDGGSIPGNWEETIAACLAKDPAHRPQSAGEVAWRLGLVKTFQPPITASSKRAPTAPVAAPVSVPETRGTKRPPGVLIAAAVLVFLIVAGVGWWLAIERPRQFESASRQLREELVAANQARQVEAAAAAEAKRQKEKADAVAAAKPPAKTSIAQDTPHPPPPPAQQPVIATKKESSAPTSSPPEQRVVDSSVPNMNRELTGSYKQNGRNVPFEFASVQEEGSMRFQGVISEPYTSFGVPRDKRLWADARGEIIKSAARTKVRFTKTYRYFTQPSAVYEGEFDSATGEISGRWTLAGTSGDVFRMR